MSQSTGSRRSRKDTDRPKKPYPEFPLTPHASGAWQKKIRGKTHYFGKWGRRVNGKLERIPGDGWEDALRIYKEQADELHAGRTPRVKGDGLTVATLCNHFLTSKTRKQEAGELGNPMFNDYKLITDLLIKEFGNGRMVEQLTIEDFSKLRATMAKRWGPVRLGNAITRTRSVFKFGIDNGLFEKAIRYGTDFKKPDKAVLRRHRAKNPLKMIEAEELRRLIAAADVTMKTMILLGLNAGFGNNDCATLPCTAINLEAGWMDFPRPKTGISRRCPLWPETIEAIRQTLDLRREAKNDAHSGLLFLSERGTPCVRSTGVSRVDLVAIQFTKLVKKIGLHREGLGFYTLRHVFRTIADAARDPVAIDLIMGHTDPNMGAHYWERVDDSRLRAVVDYVRGWLFGDGDHKESGAA